MRLTKTQRFILDAAMASPFGVIEMGRGDRRGTRIGFYDELGTPVILAYQSPEYFLRARGLLEVAQTNRAHCYRITDKGRAEVARSAQ